MTAFRHPLVIGTFQSDADAMNAINNLREAGFEKEQLGFAHQTGGANITNLYEDLGTLGVPGDRASFFNDEYKSGHPVVSVRADGREQDAASILDRNNAIGFNHERGNFFDRSFNASAGAQPSGTAATGAQAQNYGTGYDQNQGMNQPAQPGGQPNYGQGMNQPGQPGTQRTYDQGQGMNQPGQPGMQPGYGQGMNQPGQPGMQPGYGQGQGQGMNQPGQPVGQTTYDQVHGMDQSGQPGMQPGQNQSTYSQPDVNQSAGMAQDQSVYNRDMDVPAGPAGDQTTYKRNAANTDVNPDVLNQQRTSDPSRRSEPFSEERDPRRQNPDQSGNYRDDV
jgi:hypothetical protein